MRQRIKRASLSVYNFSEFCPLTTFLARNDRKLFSSNRGVSHFYAAYRIDELIRGFVLGLKFSQTTSARNVL